MRIACRIHRRLPEFTTAASKYGASLKIAAAGRSRAKLDALVGDVLFGRERLPVLVGDASDAASLEAITRQTRVLLSTAGPYALLGDALVAACVKTRTDYCDITGEYPWVRSLIERHHQEASDAGVLVVNSCGFDSIPSDLGALFTVAAAKRLHPGAVVQNVDAAIGGKGGISGGTVASILNLLESSTPSQLKASMHPFYLNPAPDARKPSAHDAGLVLPAWSAPLNAYLAPYVMAPGNERCVRRSAALLEREYGTRFSYREGYRSNWLLGALLVIFAHILMFAPLMCTCTRNLLKRYVLPKPGDGPDAETRRTGWFRADFAAACVDAATGAHVATVQTRVSGGEPGYEETSKMVAETAVCLAMQRRDCARGGVLTPAAALGAPLIERLRAVGMEFAVVIDAAATQ